MEVPTRRTVQAEVRRGKLSPFEALDIAVSARLAGAPIPGLERWAEERIERIRERGGDPLRRAR